MIEKGLCSRETIPCEINAHLKKKFLEHKCEYNVFTFKNEQFEVHISEMNLQT